MSEFHEYLDRRYAIALYEVAEEKQKAEEYIKELEDIKKIIDESEDLSLVISHPELSTSKKKDIFESIFKGKIQNDILSFLLILIEKNRFMELKGITAEMKKIHLDRNRTVAAFVKTVIPLNDQERNALIGKLQQKYSKNIILNEEIDEEILGGVFVQVDNEIIDGTLKTKLEQIRKLALKK